MLPWDGDIVFYRASPGACSSQHPRLVPILVSVVCEATEGSVLLGVSSWRALISLEMFEGSAKQGRFNPCEHLTALALRGLSQSCKCDA